ncbi:MAG: YcxB family protein [Lachnospiraceae bacterium]|nr:YcxB family protein [Candidatus Merdinaster equi]
MEIDFDIKISFWNMYDFLLYKAYLSMQGIIGTLAGAFFIVMFFMNPAQVLFLVAGIVVLLFLPFDLFLKTKAIMLQSVYKKPMHYHMSDEGILISQEGAEEQPVAPWEGILKAGSTLGSLLLYTSKKTAVILPKSQLEKQNVRDAVMKIVSLKVNADKVNIR